MDNIENIDKSQYALNQIKSELLASKYIIDNNENEDSIENKEDTFEDEKILVVSEDIHYNIMEYVRRQGLCIGEYLSVNDINDFILENKGFNS